jgi:hypothetical protein
VLFRSFSIPVYPALSLIARYGPLVEIGAGSGYWAWCLARMGVDVVPIDARPPGENDPLVWDEANLWFDDSWVSIIEGDERALAGYSDRTLFMSWPDINRPFALNALRVYREAGGSRLIYLGDAKSSGDEAFHRALAALHQVTKYRMPGWPGIDDYVIQYAW